MSRKVVRNMITKVLRHNLNNRGLTLMEIMVAAGVMGIVALYVAHIISDMIVNKNTAEFFSVRHSIRSDLNNFLLKNNTCRCSFNDVIIPGSVAVTDAPINIPSLDIYQDPDDPNCPAGSITKNVIRTGAVNDKTLVVAMELGQIQRLSDRQFLSHLVVTVENQRNVLGPKRIPIDVIFPLQVVDAGGGAYQITGCGQEPPAQFTVLEGGITQNMRGGRHTYTFPNISGRTLGLVQFDFRWGKNFFLSILDPRNPRRALDVYDHSTATDGHVRHTTFTALIPLVNGQFIGDFDCNCGRNASDSKMTLIATIPVL